MSERDEFEAWAKSKGLPLCMSMALTVADLRETNRAWDAWQAARATLQPVAAPAWQPIETAPKDGTAIDLWVDGEFSHRRPGCFWGLPHHCCGEMGSYCDSEWHDLEPGWVDDFNQPLSELDRKPTHWMPLPAAPTQNACGVASDAGSIPTREPD